jgi:hypothetical protein
LRGCILWFRLEGVERIWQKRAFVKRIHVHSGLGQVLVWQGTIDQQLVVRSSLAQVSQARLGIGELVEQVGPEGCMFTGATGTNRGESPVCSSHDHRLIELIGRDSEHLIIRRYGSIVANREPLFIGIKSVHNNELFIVKRTAGQTGLFQRQALLLSSYVRSYLDDKKGHFSRPPGAARVERTMRISPFEEEPG